MYLYFYYIQVQLQRFMQYRVDFFVRFVIKLYYFAAQYALWSLSSSSQEQNERLLVYYFLIFTIMHASQGIKLSTWISEDIRGGNLNNFLIKPVNYIFLKCSRLFSYLFLRISLSFVILIVLIIIKPDLWAPYSLLNFLGFILFFVFNVVIWNLLMIIMGLLSFWVVEVDFLTLVLIIVLNILKGIYIPYYLFPASLQRFLSLTPFVYFGGYPIEIYQSSIGSIELIKGLGIGIIWVLVLSVLVKFLYTKGIKRYEGIGI